MMTTIKNHDRKNGDLLSFVCNLTTYSLFTFTHDFAIYSCFPHEATTKREREKIAKTRKQAKNENRERNIYIQCEIYMAKMKRIWGWIFLWKYSVFYGCREACVCGFTRKKTHRKAKSESENEYVLG